MRSPAAPMPLSPPPAESRSAADHAAAPADATTGSSAFPRSSAILEANLAALTERNRDIADCIRAAASSVRLELHASDEGAAAGAWTGISLCSRRRPLEEAIRLADTIDLREHAVIVVFGFGLGWHVQQIAQRLQKTGVIIVVEPDVALARSVMERIDHAQWMRSTNLVWTADPNDLASLTRKLTGAESVLAQGVAFLEHPPSRRRLGTLTAEFTDRFSELITAAKTTLVTTLMRSTDTVHNLLLNLDHYVAGPGISDLAGSAKHCPAVVVSAGPSLHRNLAELAKPGVRERCVIIAVQTTLKPLLAAGIRPHFVAALDYHEISRRFHEDIDPAALEGVTLIAEPKVHPVVLDVFLAMKRCSGNPFLDRLLGPCARSMGTVQAGATVAHLCVYLAEYLGCDPIILMGQDLGFTDGLYYAPRTAIHDVWAPELNSFNTIEMMEWQRIARHRSHLHKLKDVNGRPIYSDAQMMTYLRQFERDFAAMRERGIEIIDATEGGVVKQGATIMPLRDALERYATTPLPTVPEAPAHEPARLSPAAQRVRSVRSDVVALRDVSRRTAKLLQRMLDDQRDTQKMDRHFAKLDRLRADVDDRQEAFDLLQQFNQMGVFKRMKADRAIHMRDDLSPLEAQRLQLERDLQNVTWLADAAEELARQLADGLALLEDSREAATDAGVQRSAKPRRGERSLTRAFNKSQKRRIAALIAIDPQRMHLAQRFNGRSVLQATLERLDASTCLGSIVLIAPHAFDLDAHLDRSGLTIDIEIERVDGSPFPPEHEAIMIGRSWADRAWRSGVAGLGIFDELLCPQVMHEIMARRGIEAALLVGPDWPMVQVIGGGGCDAVIERFFSLPERAGVVFTQAPPGVCGCVVGAALMQSLAQRNRLATIGGLLTYQPSAPQADPIAKDVNVQIEPGVRNALTRLTCDTPQRTVSVEQALRACGNDADAAALLQWIERHERGDAPAQGALPEEIIIELTPQRSDHGLFAATPLSPIEREPMSLHTLEHILSQMQESSAAPRITFAGVGDPLCHPHFDECIARAKRHGATPVHVRTALLCDHAAVDRLLAAGVDLITVDLHADRAATYEIMMGCDGFKEVLLTLEYLLDHRRSLTGQRGTSAIALPWVLPALQRRAETLDDIDTFFDRWQHMLGTALLEGPPDFSHIDGWQPDALAPAVTPQRAIDARLARRMTIHSDGRVPWDELDLRGDASAGDVTSAPLHELWRRARAQRITSDRPLRWFRP